MEEELKDLINAIKDVVHSAMLPEAHPDELMHAIMEIDELLDGGPDTGWIPPDEENEE